MPNTIDQTSSSSNFSLPFTAILEDGMPSLYRCKAGPDNRINLQNIDRNVTLITSTL
jgi:hypothetical protein